MAKRLFDIAFALIALVVSAPLILFGVIGIKISSPGSVIFPARRVGKRGAIFTMYKLRTMHITRNEGSSITAPGDGRIFVFGEILRGLKIDELPQFWNILRGDMSIVGPRAEAVEMVEDHFTGWMRETLEVAPGATSPGAIYNYIMSEKLLDPNDPEGSYVRHMLIPKLALERAYIERINVISDLYYIVLTIKAIAGNALGRKVRLPTKLMRLASKWAPDEYFSGKHNS